MQSEILECGHAPSPHGPHTTGYGTDRDGRKHCYQCCAEKDVEQMTRDGRTVLYLCNREVTNWPGSLRFPVYYQKTGRHNMAGKRYDVWFHGPDKHIWRGTQYGDNTQICHCRRTKEKSRGPAQPYIV